MKVHQEATIRALVIKAYKSRHNRLDIRDMHKPFLDHYPLKIIEMKLDFLPPGKLTITIELRPIYD